MNGHISDAGRRPASTLLRLIRYAAGFRPAPVLVDGRERLRAVIGAGLGILLTGLLSRWWAGADVPALSLPLLSLPVPSLPGPWLIAPLGASAVLVFAVPASPLAQPWSVIAGNTLSALVGSACAMLIGDPVWAAATAVALAIALMFALRCLHPPGGASALFAALGATSFQFAVFPVLFNSILMVIAGLLYNQMTGRPYPHAALRPPAPKAPSADFPRFSGADLDAALARYNQVLDINRDDLEDLLHQAESIAYQRHIGQLRCRDIMSGDPRVVSFGTPLHEAWEILRRQKIKALPVTDRARRVVGIITVADFMRHADLLAGDGIGQRLRSLIRRPDSTHSERVEVVGQVMSREVRVVSDTRYVSELVSLFTEAGHHHIPVIDADQRLVGIITQSDLVRALHQVAAAEPG